MWDPPFRSAIINSNPIWLQRDNYRHGDPSNGPANTEQAVISSMHRSYQPLKPVTNRYLQQRWDQNDYENHRKKVSVKVEECRACVEVKVYSNSKITSGFLF